MAKALSSYSVGSIVKIKENGVLSNFIVIAHGYPAIGQTLLLRETVSDDMVWNTSPVLYKNSAIDRWLNSEYLNTIDSNIRSKISDSSIQCATSIYDPDGSPNENINRKVFLLSAREVLDSGSGVDNNEGQKIAYFNSVERRKANNDWYTRSFIYGLSGLSNYRMVYLHADGSTVTGYYNQTPAGARPAFCLPGSAGVNESTGEILA